ncbi:MAG TPA: hypothetical protein VGR35_19005 [Tepidisphaeraceae bacterium]|nr:hypothetical protein [Tepidisphaeraceae bacterium]
MKDPVGAYVTLFLVVVVGLIPLGCSSPGPDKDVRNPDPLGKIPAYKHAVRLRDRSAVRQMVKDLDSNDPAVRLFAIVGLRRLTGQTFGYEYFEEERQRRPAIARWEAWLEGDEVGAPQDAAAGGSDGAAEAPNPASGP